ncbi:MAG: HAMP domain-containing protein [Bacteroidetes bacterium]|nr:MAG: HAMP domain-containing protein [Bacteroidota bacterium]TAG89066.1 MAG: HAMP domain-containing protein [Bacteroidota bacterium]
MRLKFHSLRIRFLATFLLFTSLTIIVAVVSLWFYHQTTQLATITSEIESSQMQAFRILKTEQDFLNYDASNPQFYEKKTSAYLEKHHKLLDTLKKQLYKLLEMNGVKTLKTQKNNIKEDIKRIIQQLETYEKTFKEITDKLIKRGWTTSGLEGELIEHYHHLEKKYENSYPEVKNLYVGETAKLKIDDCYELAKRLQSVTEEAKSTPRLLEKEQFELLKTLAEYESTLSQIIQIEETLGTDKNQGLQKKLRFYSEETTNLMEKLVYAVNKEVILIENYLFKLFGSIILFMISVGVFLSYWVANIITKPIEKLSDTIRTSVDRKFSGEVSLVVNNSKDEVGKLTRDFNVMLKEIHHRLGEIRVNNAKLEVQNEELNQINNQLKDSEKHLTKLNEVKDTFFSIISHDLRAPLNTLNGFLGVLKIQADAFSPEELKNFAEDMEKSIERLHNLLENLLQWSLSQTGDIEFKPQKIKLMTIVLNNVGLYTQIAKNKEINLITDVEDNIWIYADNNMTDFILRNLISNAIKFSNKNSTIEIISTHQNGYVQITVQDHGVGMSKEHLEKVFEPEEHISTTGTQSEKGTGFGLLLCKNFVEKNGGKIEVESIVNEGTKIHIFLPKSV